MRRVARRQQKLEKLKKQNILIENIAQHVYLDKLKVVAESEICKKSSKGSSSGPSTTGSARCKSADTTSKQYSVTFGKS